MSPRKLLAVLIVAALGAIAAFAAHPSVRPQAPVAEEHEGAALQEPSDVLLSRELFGSDTSDPAEVSRRAQAQARELGARTRAVDPSLAAAQWQLVGPTNVGGRVLDIAVDPAAADTIFIASAGGGVWKSTDAGSTFSSVWPVDAAQAIGALSMTPSGVLYAGTGEAGPGGGSLTYGGTGVYRSDDRGATWRRIGLEGTSRISRIVIDPTNERRIFVAATGNLYKPGGERGLYRSDDGGDSWKLVLAGENATTGATDLAIDPKNPKVMYAAVWDALREPDRSTYNGMGSGVFKSTDGGDTWTRIDQPFLGPSPEMGRIGVTVASANTLYAGAAGPSGGQNGFFRSTDGGATFTPSSSADLVNADYVYGWWFGRVWTDPKDPNAVWVAGVNMAKSTDGGQTWDSPGGFHADQHAMAWDPKKPGRVYLGNDGGLYRSDDNGSNWKFARYMPLSIPYSVDVGEQDPSRVTTGLQDNGSNRSWGGKNPDDWNEFYGGDGQRTLINPRDQKIVYGCLQYGDCAVSTDEGKNMSSFGDSVVSSRKNWFTPIEFDPEDPHTIYTGGEIMSRSSDDAGSFTPISGDLSTGRGRETNPLFKNYGTITTIAPAGLSTKTIYAGTDDGNLWYTHDLGSTWTKATDPDLPKAWITRVEVEKGRPNTAYVTYSGFRQDDDAAYVFMTNDGGKSWRSITFNLPKAPVNDINHVGRRLVVATDVGVFYLRNERWLKYGSGLPLAPGFELRYPARSHSLFAGTFGRGIYRIPTGPLE